MYVDSEFSLLFDKIIFCIPEKEFELTLYCRGEKELSNPMT